MTTEPSNEAKISTEETETDEEVEEAEAPITSRPTARVQELPIGWTQMAEKSPADRLRYPHDVAAELNETDTDIMIVGTAGQKITQMGPDFSTKVNPNITELVMRSHLIKKMEGLEGFTKLELLELYDNQVEELNCLDKGENGAPGQTLRVLDMSYNVIRDMVPVALCPNLQELCKL
jgi:Leucine-rich repeat (LRR) protein